MNRYRITTALPTLVVWAVVYALAVPTQAQVFGGRVVESLERYGARIEQLLDERLAGLISSGNYVLRVRVDGEPALAPRQRPPGSLELPGFRQTLQEAMTAADGFRVTRVAVRILVHETLSEADIDYLRSLVPIVADFEPNRGDTLDLQFSSPGESLEESAEAAEQPSDTPLLSDLSASDLSAEESAGSPGSLGETMGGFTLRDWVLIGLMALALLLLLVVLLRISRGAKDAPQPPATPMGAAALAAGAPAAELTAEEKRHLQALEENRELEQVRKDVVKSLVGRPDLTRQLVGEWQGQPKQLMGLVQALGPTISRQALLPYMDEAGYRSLEDSVRNERPLETRAITALLREARLYFMTQEFAQPEQYRPDPFGFLTALSRGQIGHLIADEPVRVKAIVLSRISADDTASILDSMPREMQLEVAVQIGNFQSLPLDAIAEVGLNLAEKARLLPDEKTVDIEGPQTLVDLMTLASTDTISYLLDALKSKDTRLSDKVTRRLFLFESIPLVPDEVMPQVVRQMPSDKVIQAIQGADRDLQSKVIRGFPEQVRTGLVTTLRAARYDAQTVLDARQHMVRRFQELGAAGRINLKQISDAWQTRDKAS